MRDGVSLLGTRCRGPVTCLLGLDSVLSWALRGSYAHLACRQRHGPLAQVSAVSQTRVPTNAEHGSWPPPTPPRPPSLHGQSLLAPFSHFP